MKQIRILPIPVLALAIAAISIFTTTVQAEDTGFYTGVSLGFGKSDKLCDDGPFAHGCTDEAWAGKAFVGYRFNHFIGAEASLMRVGDVSYSKESDAGLISSDEFEHEYSLGLSVVVHGPLFGKVAPFARVGLHKYAVSREARTSGPGSAPTFTQHEDGTDLLLGVGAKYPLSEHTTLRAEWERLELDYSRWPDDEADVFSIGIARSF